VRFFVSLIIGLASSMTCIILRISEMGLMVRGEKRSELLRQGMKAYHSAVPTIHSLIDLHV
jgi:hypothetical protein